MKALEIITTAQFLLGAVLVDKIYKEYDFFAYFYNKYWMKHAPKYFKKALEILLFQHIKKGSNILDVCCGTGHAANIMEKAGYIVEGMDGSQLMLDYAKENAKKCSFFQGDARNFNLGKKYKGITCLFDSINHMLSSDDLLQVFKNIYNHLEDNGVFLFDVNSLESCVNVFMGDVTVVEENTAFISMGSYNEEDKLITYNLTAFIKEDNHYIRQDSVVYEKYYSEKTLMKYLKESGFKNINITYGQELNIEAFEDRIFFTVWK